MFSNNSVAAFLEKAYEAILQNVLDVERVFVAVFVHKGCQCALSWSVSAEGSKFKIGVVGVSKRSAHVDRDALFADMFVSGV